MKYIPGKQNIADPLFRLTQPRETVQPSKPPPNDADEFVKFIAVTATPKAMTTREIERALAEDDELSELRRCITTNQWESTQCKKYIPVSSELCVIGKLVLRSTRIVIPQVSKIQYVPGQEKSADVLSRLPFPHQPHVEQSIADEYINYIVTNALPKAMTLDQIEKAVSSIPYCNTSIPVSCRELAQATRSETVLASP